MNNMLVIGGSGSLGKALLGYFTKTYNVSVFSRDEAKHVVIKQMFPKVKSLIGDVRDRDAVINAIIRSEPHIIINASALKNVPEVEEVPMEGIKTSLLGTENIIQALNIVQGSDLMKVLTVSTDKATSPCNAYGMAKALQERLHIRSNNFYRVCNAVRYGNVLDSRGSLIPLIRERFQNKQPVFITHPDMTRFFLTLDQSVELINHALNDIDGGKIFIPIIKSAKIADVIDIYREQYELDSSFVKESHIRPGEKIHESLVSVEETRQTEKKDGTYIIHDILYPKNYTDVTEPFCSGNKDVLMNRDELKTFLQVSGVL